MKKLHSFAFYALVTPAIVLGSGAAFAEQSADKAGQDGAMEQKSSQDNQTGMNNQSYLESVPAGGIQASELISAEIKTNDDEDVGSVTDLIIDKDGQVAAVVVGVGGFLGMAEKDVAIGWDDLTMSRDSAESDDLELRVNMTRDDLNAAPSYENLDD
ncbi:MAG: PRC-barrel domain-containing protein [Marinobacter sp.]